MKYYRMPIIQENTKCTKVHKMHKPIGMKIHKYYKIKNTQIHIYKIPKTTKYQLPQIQPRNYNKNNKATNYKNYKNYEKQNNIMQKQNTNQIIITIKHKKTT